jgi:hypothetical protein
MPSPKSRRHGKKRGSSNFKQLSTRSLMRADPVYTVTKRVIGLATCTSSNAIETFSSNGISLNAFTGYASLTGAFDQYRFDQVEVEYLPRIAVADGAGASNPGVFVSVVDFDDSTNLTSVAEALAYPNAQVWTGAPGKTPLLKHRFVPRIATAAYQGGVFSGFANQSKLWVDAGTPGVAHYGVKTAWSVTSVALIMDILITATISFRSSRA